MVEHLPNEKSSTTAAIMTSHPVVTSSPIGEMTSRKASEDVQQVETAREKSTPSTSSLIKDVMRSSQALKIEASPLLTKQETTYTLPSPQEKQILFSQTKEELTSSLFTEIESSSVLEQVFSSEAKDKMTAFKVLEINASPIIKEQEKSSSLSAKPVRSTSFPIKRPLSSQTTEKLSSSKVLDIESSPVIEEKETPSLMVKPAASKERDASSKQILSQSLAQEEMTLSQLVTSPSIQKSSLDDKEAIPLETVQATVSFKIEPSSLGLKEMTSLPKKMMISSQLVRTLASSGALEPASVKTSSSTSKDDNSSQQIEDRATPQVTGETKTPSKLSTSLISTAVGPILSKSSLQQLEDTMSPSLTKSLSSSRLLTSLEVSIRSSSLKISTEPTMTSSPMGTPTPVMTSPQVNKDITSLSQTSSLENTKTSLLKTNIVTSSKSITDLTSSQTLISTSFKEVNIVISALILSSSQIADLVTSSPPMTMKALTSSAAESTEQKEPSTTETTKPLDGEKTTTPKLPEEKTTTPSEMNTSGKKSVAMTTSHPTHLPVHPSETTHHTKPVHPGNVTHHGDKNTTNKTHDGHEVNPGSHVTMGFPDEQPVVEASTDEEDDNSWQISVVVVCALIIGMVSFVIVFVVKSNRDMKR